MGSATAAGRAVRPHRSPPSHHVVASGQGWQAVARVAGCGQGGRLWPGWQAVAPPRRQHGAALHMGGAAYGRRCTAYTSHAALLVVRVCADGVTVVAAEEEHGRAWVRVRVGFGLGLGLGLRPGLELRLRVRAEAEGESGG